MNVVAKTPRELQGLSGFQDQVGSLGRREAVLPAELNRSFGTGVGALGTKQAPPEVDPERSAIGNRVGRTHINAGAAT